jgi:hypothetical protein
MKRFIQFYSVSTGYVQGTIPPVFKDSAKVPIPACGSDSICFIDGRLSLCNRVNLARKICGQRNYIGFTIECGSLLNSTVVHPLELI